MMPQSVIQPAKLFGSLNTRDPTSISGGDHQGPDKIRNEIMYGARKLELAQRIADEACRTHVTVVVTVANDDRVNDHKYKPSVFPMQRMYSFSIVGSFGISCRL